MIDDASETITPFPDPIRMDLKDNPGEVEFNSFEDLQNWLNEIEQGWKPIVAKVRQLGAPGELVVNALEAPVNQLKQEIGNANQAFESGETIEEVSKNYRKTFEQNLSAFADQITLHPSSKNWQQIVKAINLNTHFGAGVLASFLGLSLDETTDGFNNFSIIQPFSNGFSFGREYLRVGETDLESLRHRLTQMNQNWGVTVDEVSKSRKKFEAEFVQQKSDQQEAGNLLIEEKRKEIDHLIKTYETHLQLEAPAKYWTDKMHRHKTAYRWAFVVFGLAVAGGIWWIGEFGPKIIVQIPPDKNGGIPLGAAALITIPAIAYFWLLRHIARFFVSNLHQAADAEQRATMITTFEALVHAPDNKVTPEALLLILQAIFRPLQSSGVDDAPPPNLLEIMRGR